jgi:hypothetical protein
MAATNWITPRPALKSGQDPQQPTDDTPISGHLLPGLRALLTLPGLRALLTLDAPVPSTIIDFSGGLSPKRLSSTYGKAGGSYRP